MEQEQKRKIIVGYQGQWYTGFEAPASTGRPASMEKLLWLCWLRSFQFFELCLGASILHHVREFHHPMFMQTVHGNV
jgi:hypothetical protein